ncbi:hypothetical protein EVAR_103464_1 [Eumeta japonica]|uniref:Uncharacterized protein n=1 Tax=Eumeta variegata TaxID=151549 RepID=A0A4C1YY66_EUMVA|nr:hypothetical protein EVAR_103464_1 [Eumeta japonica]
MMALLFQPSKRDIKTTLNYKLSAAVAVILELGSLRPPAVRSAQAWTCRILKVATGRQLTPHYGRAGSFSWSPQVYHSSTLPWDISDVISRIEYFALGANRSSLWNPNI